MVELAMTWAKTGIQADIAVMRDAAHEHRFEAPGVVVHRLGGIPWPERLAYAAALVRASRLPAYCHLTSLSEMEVLWKFGAATVPVVHNAQDGWKQAPSTWNDNPLIPFVVACGDHVAEDLRLAGLTKPVRILRHIVGDVPPMDAGQRMKVRASLGAADSTLLLGMIGRIATQKRYTRAVRILSAMLRQGVDARLVIIGGADGQEGTRCLRAIENEASRLRVMDKLVLMGAVQNAAALVSACDVFLNTSLWEGVSISTMEAVAASVPVVVSDVGGQREAVGVLDTLMPTEATDAEWADAVMLASGKTLNPVKTNTNRAVFRDALPSMWPWMAALGPGASLQPLKSRPDVLFITGNMDVGGAQRSLCNLVAEFPGSGVRAAVAVAGSVGVPHFMDAARANGVEFIDVSGAGGSSMGALCGRMGRILSLVLARAPKVVCFWNMDAITKLAVAKVLQDGPVGVVDVSPGPMFYRELDMVKDTARLLSTSMDAYIRNLDLMVHKYAVRDNQEYANARMTAIIPNGVPRADGELPYGVGPSPLAGEGHDRENLSVITVGRLVAAKRPELLPLVARELARRVPNATLTVVGGTHAGDRDGSWQSMLSRCPDGLPSNLRFVGPDSRTLGFLGRFACFYMVSTEQGCPNASLEAMACGLPVVANPNGGTKEQVIDGKTGFLVDDPGNDEDYACRLADALANLLLDPARRKAMGAAAQAHVQTMFSMQRMAMSYASALGQVTNPLGNNS